jgi:hypothetical protein
MCLIAAMVMDFLLKEKSFSRILKVSQSLRSFEMTPFFEIWYQVDTEWYWLLSEVL